MNGKYSYDPRFCGLHLNIVKASGDLFDNITEQTPSRTTRSSPDRSWDNVVELYGKSMTQSQTYQDNKKGKESINERSNQKTPSNCEGAAKCHNSLSSALYKPGIYGRVAS